MGSRRDAGKLEFAKEVVVLAKINVVFESCSCLHMKLQSCSSVVCWNLENLV